MSEVETKIASDHDQDETFWQEHVERFNIMSTTKIKYCQQYNIGYHRFLYWHQKLSGNHDDLVPIRIKSSRSSTALCTLESPQGFWVHIHEELALTKVLSWLEN